MRCQNFKLDCIQSNFLAQIKYAMSCEPRFSHKTTISNWSCTSIQMCRQSYLLVQVHSKFLQLMYAFGVLLCSTLVPKANSWLRENLDILLVKCETLEKKVVSVDQVVADCVMFVPNKDSALYVKGLRYRLFWYCCLCHECQLIVVIKAVVHTLFGQRATNNFSKTAEAEQAIQLKWIIFYWLKVYYCKVPVILILVWRVMLHVVLVFSIIQPISYHRLIIGAGLIWA